MRTHLRGISAFLLLLLFHGAVLLGQSSVHSGTITGSVTDPSGAVIPNASITILNPVSQYTRTTTSDAQGEFNFGNVPFNPYHVSVSASGFAPFSEDLSVSSTVPVTTAIKLQLGQASSTVTVTSAGDLLENDPAFHTDVDRKMISEIPLESMSSSLSSLITLTAPGVSADSNGLFHGMGDHASNSFSIDGQPVTDQVSKVFSNQLPTNAIQSIQVIAGAPPAEYGDKTSLVIQVTTRSGEGLMKPTADFTSSYGSFGSVQGGFDYGIGSQTWGDFIEMDGLNSGRFLDAPEFAVFHDKGNEENAFDRIDDQFTTRQSGHINLNYSRSWFQTPNDYDNLHFGINNPVTGAPLGPTDQKSKIETFDIAPVYTFVISSNTVLNFGPYIRKDAYSYFPSGDPFADINAPNLQNQTISQYRTLTNAGVHSDLSYVKGIHNFKAGGMYEQTILREYDSLGVVAPAFNAPCLNAAGRPVAGFSNPSECAVAGYAANPSFLPVLLPYDLTRGGKLFNFFGHTDVKELALYIEDQINTKNWVISLGMRGDVYNGLTDASQAEPRIGLAYTIQKTGTVLQASYARTLETPFNENLVLSSTGCTNAVLAPLLSCTPGVSGKLPPGFRNEFHLGFQQAAGRFAVISAEYIWKYTHNAFDFSVLGNTPITFPIDWHNAKIPGFAARVEVPTIHNVSAYVVMSSVAARFFPPQVGGAGATVGQTGYPFRIDHDEKFNQTTHIQYQFTGKRPVWLGFNWRFDSGQVAGAVPCYTPFSVDPNSPCGTPANPTSTILDGQPAVNLSSLTADEEFQAGLSCNGVKATPTQPLPSVCLASQLKSNLVSIPAPGTANADHNPQRVQPRSLFDLSLGDDNLFSGDRYKWSLTLTGVNIANNYALYNFLSTFSGTHYVTPRALTAELGFHF